MTVYNQVNWVYLAGKIQRVCAEAAGPGFEVDVSPAGGMVALVITYRISGEAAVTQIDRSWLFAPVSILRENVRPVALEMVEALVHVDWHHGLAANMTLGEA
ncbi:MAG TPA: hypothetical protein VMW94_09270 [Actinomycetes bacterium]|nr:hypothetical protein [Actinomycetes bacterium]